MGLWQSTPVDITTTTGYTWVKERTEEHPVVMFSKTTCGYCRVAKKTLDNNEISYQAHEINHMANCQQIQEALHYITGASTVPRVFINGKSIGGCDDLTRLHHRGMLKEMLKSKDNKEYVAESS